MEVLCSHLSWFSDQKDSGWQMVNDGFDDDVDDVVDDVDDDDNDLRRDSFQTCEKK